MASGGHRRCLCALRIVGRVGATLIARYVPLRRALSQQHLQWRHQHARTAYLRMETTTNRQGDE